MDEQKIPDPQKPEKKLSRTTLTFYIVALFSVAIALILISYIAQTRADRQLDTLTDQLTAQQTVAQGATQKMEDLQKQYDHLMTAVEKVRGIIGTEQAKTDIVSAAQDLSEERTVSVALARIMASLLAEQREEALRAYTSLTQTYGARLTAEGEDAFPADILALVEQIEQALEIETYEEQ